MFSTLSLVGICHLLAQKKLVIASVNPNIRGIPTANSNQIGGHLVLVVGYNSTNQTVTIHNPSGFVSNDSQEFQVISTDEFSNYFAGRGIALEKNGV